MMVNFNLKLYNMKLNRDIVDNFRINSIYKMLLEHFEYSIKDINSYEELTKDEKDIIPRDLFDSITKK